MSYTLTTPCYSCKKNTRCMDGDMLGEAVSRIHQNNILMSKLGLYTYSVDPRVNEANRGHLGCGSIEMKCSNFEQK